MKSDEPLEILVRAPNWLGDLVMSTPGFRALRAGFPSARIHLQLPSELVPLLAGAPWFDALIPQKAHAGLRETLRAGRRLASLRRFDLGLCLLGCRLRLGSLGLGRRLRLLSHFALGLCLLGW